MELKGFHNELNQLTHRAFSGGIDVLGHASTADVKVGGGAVSVFNSSNFVASVLAVPGTNVIPVVAWSGGLAMESNVTAVLPPNPEQYRYDLNGNLLADAWRNYEWDAENRLIAIESRVGTIGPAVRRRSEFTCDAQWRRVRARHYAWDSGTDNWQLTTDHCFVWNDWLLVSEVRTQASGVSTNHYAWGLDLSGTLQGAGGIGGLLAVTTLNLEPATLNCLLPLADGNGNITEYATGTGTVVARFEYDPFGGTVREEVPAGVDLPFRFSSKYEEAEWGVYYYGYRYYSPEVGRWLSRDPVGSRGGVNLYVLIRNHAISSIDALGLKEEQPHVVELSRKSVEKLCRKLPTYEKHKKFLDGYEYLSHTTIRVNAQYECVFWCRADGSKPTKKLLMDVIGDTPKEEPTDTGHQCDASCKWPFHSVEGSEQPTSPDGNSWYCKCRYTPCGSVSYKWKTVEVSLSGGESCLVLCPQSSKPF